MPSIPAAGNSLLLVERRGCVVRRCCQVRRERPLLTEGTLSPIPRTAPRRMAHRSWSSFKVVRVPDRESSADTSRLLLRFASWTCTTHHAPRFSSRSTLSELLLTNALCNPKAEGWT